MSEPASPSGPQHLAKFLGPCPPALERLVCASQHQGTTAVSGLHCTCIQHQLWSEIRNREHSEDPASSQRGQRYKEQLQDHQQKRIHPGSSARLRAVQDLTDKAPPTDRRQPCRVFAVEVNEEEGLVRAFCRRCQKMLLLFDRTLYWGMPRPNQQVPEAFPFRCACGGHSFELAIAFEYPDDPLDENDFHNVNIGARCPACETLHMLLDEEG